MATGLKSASVEPFQGPEGRSRGLRVVRVASSGCRAPDLPFTGACGPHPAVSPVAPSHPAAPGAPAGRELHNARVAWRRCRNFVGVHAVLALFSARGRTGQLVPATYQKYSCLSALQCPSMAQDSVYLPRGQDTLLPNRECCLEPGLKTM